MLGSRVFGPTLGVGGEEGVGGYDRQKGKSGGEVYKEKEVGILK